MSEHEKMKNKKSKINIEHLHFAKREFERCFNTGIERRDYANERNYPITAE